MTQMKNYVAFANDHSGSMSGLARAAIKDYNTNIAAVKDAATANMLDTIVSAVSFGVGRGSVERTVVNSNPHVLKPMESWPTSGNTPLYDAVGDIITLFKSMPDYSNPNVSFLAMITTDGEENSSSKYSKSAIAAEIANLNREERWTFVFRVPKGARRTLDGLGIPAGNIQEWGTTVEGMEQSTAATTQAIDTFYTTRAAGKKASTVFYANAAGVTQQQVKATLQDVSSQVSLWTVLDNENGNEIKPFAEQRLGNSPFLKGAAFYQLTKTEARIQDYKMIVLRDKATGHVYFGTAARDLIGLPHTGTVRLHPGDHGAYDIFIQSTSINRKLVAGTQVMYWPKMGTGFTAADFPWLNNGQANATPAMAQAAASAIQATAGISPVVSPAPTNKPTPSPLVGTRYFASRDQGRAEARKVGKVLKDAGKAAGKQRWFF